LSIENDKTTAHKNKMIEGCKLAIEKIVKDEQ
jgi:hypothetical protein